MSLFSSFIPLVSDGIATYMADGMLLACTSLMFRDAKGGAYSGRTMELTMELPYLVASFPKGTAFSSTVDGHPPLEFTTQYNVFSIVVPNGNIKDLKIVEGVNEAGLSFSVLAYASASGPADTVNKTKAALAAIDLGSWILGQFDTAEKVKAALAQETVFLTALAAVSGAQTPFHYTVHDRSGASLVIEFSGGKQTVYDNPVGVMTNGPEFPWHLTNLQNYSFLTNLDKSSGKLGNLQLRQPDAGIATAGLPSSNTSVGRFVRAVYYANFAEQTAPEKAMKTLSHVMNNFDRPRNITIDANSEGGLEFAGLGTDDKSEYNTEYTSWTVLTNLGQNEIYIRTYDSVNYIRFDLARLFAQNELKVAPLEQISQINQLDATDALLAAKLP